MKFRKSLVVGVLLLVSASAALIVSAGAFADNCVTRYKTECVEEDDAGRCIKFERVSYDVCTPDKDPPNVSPPKEECFDCYEYNNDGSCRKTRKIAC